MSQDINKLQEELEHVQLQIDNIDFEIQELKSKREDLKSHRSVLEQIIKDNGGGGGNYGNDNDVMIVGDDDFDNNASSNCITVDDLGEWEDERRFKWSAKLKQACVDIFGIKKYRPLQMGVLNVTLSGKDCFLIMPTGGGKSLCYQLPIFVESGLTIVVSPLISLIEDQVEELNKLNIQDIAAYKLTSSSTKDEIKIIFDLLTSGNIKMLYVTPERIVKSKRLLGKLEKLYSKNKLDRFVIDEAHCCSQWGHDFRPDYKNLGIIKTQFPQCPIIALTATAPEKIKKDVKTILKIPNCVTFKAPLTRQNLMYTVKEKSATAGDVSEEIADIIKTKFYKQCGIIYCYSKKDAENLADYLDSKDIRARCYHAYLEDRWRKRIHQDWKNNNVQVIVATVAFGMGINKLDVRFVIHHTMSKSLENYYQEIGRAGRDGLHSECILFYRAADLTRLSVMNFDQFSGLDNIYKMVRYSEESSICRHVLLANHFGDMCEPCMNRCDICLKRQGIDIKPDAVDVTEQAADICRIVDDISSNSERCTMAMLTSVWRGLNRSKMLSNTSLPKAPSHFSKKDCERIVCLLICEGVLEEQFAHTAYATNSYTIVGPKADLVMKGLYKVTIIMDSTRLKPKQKDKSTKRMASTSKQNKTNLKKPKLSEGEVVASSSIKNKTKLSKFNEVEVVELLGDSESSDFDY